MIKIGISNIYNCVWKPAFLKFSYIYFLLLLVIFAVTQNQLVVPEMYVLNRVTPRSDQDYYFGLVSCPGQS